MDFVQNFYQVRLGVKFGFRVFSVFLRARLAFGQTASEQRGQGRCYKEEVEPGIAMAGLFVGSQSSEDLVAY